MCQSRAEGGKRCAAHTRPKFLAATEQAHTLDPRTAATRIDNGFFDILDHARTPAGAREVQELAQSLEETYASQRTPVLVGAEAGEATPAPLTAEQIRVVGALQAAITMAEEANEQDRRITEHMASFVRPDSPDQFPSPTGTGRVDLEDLRFALRDPAWVEKWNATPEAERRPVTLYHGTGHPNPKFVGPVHFGDEGTALSRLANTIEDGYPAFIVEVEYRGDFTIEMPDSVANYVAHPGHAFGPGFGQTMERECEEQGWHPDEAIQTAETFLHYQPYGALVYRNNTEGYADGEYATSLVAETPPGGWNIVGIRAVTEEDWESTPY